jgi:hypothetical protein
MHRPVAICLFLACITATTATTQSASRYVPIDDWRMDYVEHLIRSGVIVDPDPLTRPLRVADLLAALRRADTSRSSQAVRSTVAMLSAGLDSADENGLYHADMWVGGEAESQARRDPVRAAGPSYSTLRAGMHLSATFGPFVGNTGPFFDRRLRFDPDYRGVDSSRIPGRLADAYLSVQGRYGEVTFGSPSRNWGPPGVDGVLLSSNPYSYDHLMIRVGTKVIRFETLVTQLDDYIGAFGVHSRRYYVTHRAVVRPHHKVVFDFGQAELLVGPNRSIEPWWLNPFKIGVFTAEDEVAADSQNSAVSGDVVWDLPGGWRVQGTLLVDDFTLTTETLPNRMGATVIVDAPLSPDVGVRVAYQMISSVAYRSQQGPDFAYTRHDVGLGHNFDDYDQTTVSASMIPFAGVLLTPELTLLRQGQGTIQTPFTLPDPDHPFLFEGVVERTWRVALSGHAQITGLLDVSGKAGVHFIQNLGHVPGATDRRFVGGITLTYRFGGPVQIHL